MRKLLLAPALLFLWTASLLSAPPNFDPPATIMPVGGYAIYNPPADCVECYYVGLDGEEPIPLRLFGGSKTAFVFPTRGLKEGQSFRFVGIASNDKGELARKEFAVPIGKQTIPPPNPKDPPVTPPPTQSLYFLIVRADGPSTPAFTKVMQMPEWNTLVKDGHTVKDMSRTDAVLLGAKLDGVTLPSILVLRTRPDGKSSEQIGIASLPSSGDQILKLPSTFTKP